MNPNCIIIHGCPSDVEKAMDPATRTYDKHWIPWTKNQLNVLGVNTETPLMPNPWTPNYEAFKAEFDKYPVSEDSVLVGHSCGCAFLVRWLGDSKQKIKKLILVAPWKIPDENDDARKAFYEYPVDPSIKNRVEKIVIFTADDEEEDGKKSVRLFHDALGGDVIELERHGHYTMGDMGTTEFPELLEKIVHFDNRKALIVPINQKREVLIQDRRGHKKPDWGYFGGEIEENETPIEAVIRESKEELDIDIKNSDLKYFGTSITKWNDRANIRYMFLYPTDQESFNVLEGKGGYWFSFDKVREHLDDKDRFDDVRKRIENILS